VGKLRYFIILFLVSNAFGQFSVTTGFHRDARDSTFYERRQTHYDTTRTDYATVAAMVNDEVFKWLPLWAWLEQETWNSNIENMLDSLSQWTGGIMAQQGLVAHARIMYGSGSNIANTGERWNRGLISSAAESKLDDRYITGGTGLISGNYVYKWVNPNKQVYGMAGIYAYVTHYGSQNFTNYGVDDFTTCPGGGLCSSLQNTWPTFTRNGRTYTWNSGATYDARLLAKDWIEEYIDRWYLHLGDGNREGDSIDYARAFPGAMHMLYTLLPKTDTLSIKSKMAGDLAMFDVLMDIGTLASTGSVMGRADWKFVRDRTMVFPTREMLGSSQDYHRYNIKTYYAYRYVMPLVIMDIIDITDEDSTYWVVHKEYNDDTLLHASGTGKMTYRTQGYALGASAAAGNNRAWQCFIQDPNSEVQGIRVFINKEDSTTHANIDDLDEGNHIGDEARMFKNAIYVHTQATPYFHQHKIDTVSAGLTWDDSTSQGGWEFRRLGRTFIAYQLGSTSAAFETAYRGLDYPTFQSFRDSVVANASLADGTSFTTSQGITITAADTFGIYNPGDQDNYPFPLMQTIDSNGDTLSNFVSADTILTWKHHGDTLIYDFNAWTIDSSGAALTPPIIITTSVKKGTISTAYTDTIKADVGACKFTIESGSLPPGLSMTAQGYLTGTPTSAGVYTYTVRAESDRGYSLRGYRHVIN